MLNVILSTVVIALLVVFFPIQSKRLSIIAFSCYCTSVAFVTLLNREDTVFGQVYLIPLEQVIFWMKRYYQAYGVGRMFSPLFGFYLNILLFVPFGFLLNCSIKKTVLFGFLFSLGIETIQYITKLGMFEIDDLLTNTLGVLIGFRFRIAKFNHWTDDKEEK